VAAVCASAGRAFADGRTVAFASDRVTMNFDLYIACE